MAILKIGADQSNPTFAFRGSIISLTVDNTCDLIGDTLSIDTLRAYVRHVNTSNSDITAINHGTPIGYYDDQGNIRGKYYIDYIRQTEHTVFEINAFSEVGLMDEEIFAGMFFHDDQFSDYKLIKAINMILPTDRYDYTVSGNAKDIRVSGLIGYGTRREAIHKLIAAYNINLVRDDTGKMLFTSLFNDITGTIPDSRLGLGGSEEFKIPASEINVESYNYTYYIYDWGPSKTVFDNSADEAAALQEDSVILFDVVAKSDYATTTGDVEFYPLPQDNYSVNFPPPRDPMTRPGKISPTGCLIKAGSKGTLKVRYHPAIVSTQRKINSAANKENIISLKGLSTISYRNVNNVLNRLYNYYVNSRKIYIDIILENEKCGRKYSFTSPYGTAVSGYIQRMTVTESAIRKAHCEVIVGYDPVSMDGIYQNSVEFRESTTWTVPTGVTEIKAVLIGKGSNGTNGRNGAAGNGQYGGNGGAGGTGGNGGDVYEEIITVSGNSKLKITVNDPIVDTKLEWGPNFANVTYSGFGDPMPGGWVNPSNGVIYAKKGKNGNDGGKGGDGGTWDDFYGIRGLTTNCVPGEDGANNDFGFDYDDPYITMPPEFDGGRGLPNAIYRTVRSNIWFEGQTWRTLYDASVFGGCGGGGGNNTINGESAYTVYNSNNYPVEMYGGNGAIGMSKTVSSIPGTGGDGGDGGGGGGGCGYGNKQQAFGINSNGEWEYLNNWERSLATIQQVGQGGAGGQGAQGADGCVIIFY